MFACTHLIGDYKIYIMGGGGGWLYHKPLGRRSVILSWTEKKFGIWEENTCKKKKTVMKIVPFNVLSLSQIIKPAYMYYVSCY